MDDVDHDQRLAALTAEMAWLRRLARALLRNDDADDLAQEAWLVASESAPRDGRPLRPWLSRVALNRVRMDARARNRREAREEAAEAIGDPTPTPAELVQRVELQQLVADAVLKLAEPYRSTVLLHYFEELSCAEIARRLGIPEATVRWRLKAALDELRARLGSRESGGLAALAPLAGVHAASTNSTSVVGVIAMKKVIAIVIALVMLVIVAVMWSGQPDERNTDTLAAKRNVLSPIGMPVAGASNVPLWMTEANVAPRRIAGRVEAAGTPVAGAVVRLALAPFVGVLMPLAEVRTDAKGVFDFGVQPASTFSISAEAPAHAPTTLTVFVADPHEKPDQLVLELQDCSLRVYGAVQDATGAGIAKARVIAAGLGGTDSDARGHYNLCLDAARTRVRVEADGYGAVAIDMMMNGTISYDFVLVPEAVVLGRVVTDSNHAVPGARVIIDPDPVERLQPLAPGWAVADDAGQFRVAGLAPGRYRVSATADGLASSTPIEVVARAGATGANAVVVVKSAVRVHGHVMMGATPVAGARVSLARNGGAVTTSSYSQPDGSFVIDEVPLGPARFVAWPYDVQAPATFVVTASSVEDVRVEVAKLATIRGRVTRHGAPVAGAEVFVPRAVSTRTAVDGTYALDGLPPGQVTINAGQANAKAFATKVATVRAGEDETVDIELDLAGEVVGVVVDAQGTPVPNVYVVLASEDGSDFGESMTDGDGRFDCFQMSGGDYGARVFPSSMAVRPFAAIGDVPLIHVPSDGPVTGVRLMIEDERVTIGGVVSDDTGAPVADAYVDTIARSNVQFARPSVMTDANGRFEIKNLVAGNYGLRAHTADGSEGTVFGIVAGTADASITLTRPGSIEGTLIGFTNAPTVEVAMLTTGYRVTSTAFVDGDRFWQHGLRPGRYAVQARSAGDVDSTEVDVRPNETAHVTLQTRATSSVEGIATEFGTKQPIAGMKCEAKQSLAGPTADPTMQGTSDARGHFAMRAPIGKVHVFCWPPDASLSIAGNDIDVTSTATASVSVTTVRAKFGAVRGYAGFSLTALTLPLQISQAGSNGAAGVQDGDQLVTIDGSSVQGMLPLGAMWVIFNHRPGTTVTLGVERGGSPMTFKVPVVAAPR